MICRKKLKNESGQVLVVVLVLVLLSSIMIAPLLTFMSTGLKTGLVFENKTAAFYAADAGIEDGVYLIKYDKLGTKFPSYSDYDYSNPSPYAYDLDNTVNGISPVHVTITNLWIPEITAPANPAAANQLINDARLIVTGGASGSKLQD